MLNWFVSKLQKQFNGGEIDFQTNDAGAIDIHRQKSEPWTKFCILYNSQLKIDHGLKYKFLKL